MSATYFKNTNGTGFGKHAECSYAQLLPAIFTANQKAYNSSKGKKRGLRREGKRTYTKAWDSAVVITGRVVYKLHSTWFPLDLTLKIKWYSSSRASSGTMHIAQQSYAPWSESLPPEWSWHPWWRRPWWSCWWNWSFPPPRRPQTPPCTSCPEVRSAPARWL